MGHGRLLRSLEPSGAGRGDGGRPHRAPAHRRLWRLWGRWWVGRRGLQGGDDAMLSSLLWLFQWAVWGGRHGPRRRLERLRASGIRWTFCRTDAELRAYLARYPGATERFDADVRRGKREPEAIISGRRRE